MISIVICSINPANFDAVRHNLSSALGDQPHEYVGVHDAESIAAGYNRGIKKARGERIILCHDDIEIITPELGRILEQRLGAFDLIGVAGSTRVTGPAWVHAGPPHIFGQVAHWVANERYYDVHVWGAPARLIPGIRVMDGVFLAGNRNVFEAIPFDEQTFRGFHLYDLDFTLRASLAGFKLAVCNDLMLIHNSAGNFDQRWIDDGQRFVAKHKASFDPSSAMAWAAMRIRIHSRAMLPGILSSPYWKD
jgi:GT2 family glycosyltransferase